MAGNQLCTSMLTYCPKTQNNKVVCIYIYLLAIMVCSCLVGTEQGEGLGSVYVYELYYVVVVYILFIVSGSVRFGRYLLWIYILVEYIYC